MDLNYVFGEEGDTLDRLSPGQKYNRNKCMEWCAERRHVPMNTWFQKSKEELVT